MLIKGDKTLVSTNVEIRLGISKIIIFVNMGVLLKRNLMSKTYFQRKARYFGINLEFILIKIVLKYLESTKMPSMALF